MAARLRSPLVLLAILSVLSFAARVAWLGEPCTSPCRSPKDHVLIFDEVYYVNAARVIDGIAPPPGNHYVGTPPGDDPNSEHPQLVKLIIAGLMKVFGDGPFAWRIGSVVMGSLAILGMFALAIAAGAGRWTALGAAALMASDNLLLVAGRIGTLDIYAVTAMIWATVLYLRRHPLLAGIVLGVGTACKEVAPYALVVLALIEAARWWRMHDAGEAAGAARAALARLGGCLAACAGVFVGLLALMDKLAPPYNDTTGTPLKAGPLHHLAHIFSYGTQLSSPHGPQGIASYPWEWLFDFKPIVYLNINPSQPAPGLENVHPAVHFLGVISPPMLLPAIPALVLAAVTVRGLHAHRGHGVHAHRGHGVHAHRGHGVHAHRGHGGRAGAWLRPPPTDGPWVLGEAPIVGLAWVAGTLGPFALLSLFLARTSYLYYMVLVMPGLYLVLAGLAVRARHHRRVLITWIALIVVALVVMYPFTPLP